MDHKQKQDDIHNFQKKGDSQKIGVKRAHHQTTNIAADSNHESRNSSKDITIGKFMSNS